MELHILKPRKALNKAFLKVKPNRSEIEIFKTNLTQLLDSINDTESEEFHKNLVIDFLKKTYYDPNHFVNTKGWNDLVIHNGDKATSTVGVIIEAKKPTNKTEMLTKDKINVKAFHELVLYYLRERITLKNIEIKHLIATNINEWFIFDVMVFDRLFAQNKNFVKQFYDFEGGRLADTKTDFFYKQIAEPFISEIKQNIEFTYFDIREFEKPLRNDDKKDDNKLIALFKLLSPEHLLKLPFANDSNTLDKRFYSELLHIIGLTETKERSKKVIERYKEGERNSGTLLENAIIQLDSLDKISRLENPNQYGANLRERLFNIGLELSITWINRILFLKLLEAQLVNYNKGDKSFEFLNTEKIKDYDDLNSLFFQVLAQKQNERNEDVKTAFSKVPYLNSSLFEPTEIEHSTIFINQLQDDKTIPLYSQTVLKDDKGNKLTGEINPLEYLFAFLSAYDFASEGSEEIQEDNKTLINASVLGLIFEKINGYKDGSFFTPGFITMYMCRETIRKSVIQKFNETKGWNCTDIKSLYNNIEVDKTNEANEIVNSIKICDPAVGSGHFLVSALNEMIAIKNDLKILQDREGLRLKEYNFEVVNDELIVTDKDGELFEYNPTSKESQRVQEALFHEKQTIIENCLFGVDINPNSVKICRLRLWIELLKNAYYKNETELETLPNIDINIKCGNSLISRFALDADLKQALRKSTSKWTIDGYRVAVSTYRNAQSKEQKREMECLINEIKTKFRSEISLNDPKVKRLRALNGELFSMTNQGQLFELSQKEKTEWNSKVAKLTSDIQKLEAEIEEIKSNKIFENAFEWRFEFPEVLNEDGDFVGFDVVIGNPPYVFTRGNEFDSIKNYIWDAYPLNQGKINLYSVFLELGLQKLLKPKYYLSFITPETFIRTSTYARIREYVVRNSEILSLDIYGIGVFEGVTAETITFFIRKTIPNNNIISVAKFNYQKDKISYNVNQEYFLTTPEFRYVYNSSSGDNVLFDKLLQNSTLLGEIVDVRNGIATKSGKNNFISKVKENEKYKKLLEAPEIYRYGYKWSGNYINYDKDALHRPRKEDTFLAKKILCQRVSPELVCCLDNEQYYTFNSINNLILINSDFSLEQILAFLNSKLLNYYYKKMFSMGAEFTITVTKKNLSVLPIKNINISFKRELEALVKQITTIKIENPKTNTVELENQIDQLVYQLYELTDEEIEIIENGVK